MSVRPVRLVSSKLAVLDHVRIYSKPHFEGEQREFEAKTTDCGSVVPMSFRVIRGSWLLFDEEGYSGNQFVLEEGLYPDIVSCDCTAAAIKSLKPIPHVSCFTDPCISLFSLDSFEGLKMTALKSDANVSNFFTQSLRVSGGLWVVYEFSNFKGRHRLLQAGEYPFWSKHSGWDTVGSFRPLTQRRVYIQVRNRALGTVLTTERVKDTSCPAKVTLSTAGALDTQQWLFTEGLLKCKVSCSGCLAVIGGKANAGSRVALWPEHGRTHQRWSLNADGTVSTHLNHDLVLDLRGGTGLDKDHLIVSDVYSHKATQYWDFELV
uniref:Beta/gamma crystallin 'Greek key' domain-containing protein n=1 Tax=Denticeps clupeoides TaxID=299321 RepID=A0AAY4EMB8_9TELE